MWNVKQIEKKRKEENLPSLPNTWTLSRLPKYGTVVSWISGLQSDKTVDMEPSLVLIGGGKQFP